MFASQTVTGQNADLMDSEWKYNPIYSFEDSKYIVLTDIAFLDNPDKNHNRLIEKISGLKQLALTYLSKIDSVIGENSSIIMDDLLKYNLLSSGFIKYNTRSNKSKFNKRTSYKDEFVLLSTFAGTKLVIVPSESFFDEPVVYDITVTSGLLTLQSSKFNTYTKFSRASPKDLTQPISVNKKNTQWNYDGLYGKPKKVLLQKQSYEKIAPGSYIPKQMIGFQVIEYSKNGNSKDKIELNHQELKESYYDYFPNYVIIKETPVLKKGSTPDSTICVNKSNSKEWLVYIQNELSYKYTESTVEDRVSKFEEYDLVTNNIIREEQVLYDNGIHEKLWSSLKDSERNSNETEFWYLEFDSKKNWTKRIVIYVNYEDGVEIFRQEHLEIREITYY